MSGKYRRRGLLEFIANNVLRFYLNPKSISRINDN